MIAYIANDDTDLDALLEGDTSQAAGVILVAIEEDETLEQMDARHATERRASCAGTGFHQLLLSRQRDEREAAMLAAGKLIECACCEELVPEDDGIWRRACPCDQRGGGCLCHADEIFLCHYCS